MVHVLSHDTVTLNRAIKVCYGICYGISVVSGPVSFCPWINLVLGNFSIMFEVPLDSC